MKDFSSNSFKLFKDTLNLLFKMTDYINFNLNYIFIALLKLSLSAICSFVIALERELNQRPGGAATHVLVGFGSCLFTLTSIHLQDQYPANNADPARICAQIVSGMGFLGSATIFKSNNYVKGINTASNLWISAAISMAIACDLWELSLITSIFTLIVLLINNRYKNWRYKEKPKKKSIIQPVLENDLENKLENVLSRDPLDAPYGDENDSKID